MIPIKDKYRIVLFRESVAHWYPILLLSAHPKVWLVLQNPYNYKPMTCVGNVAVHIFNWIVEYSYIIRGRRASNDK